MSRCKPLSREEFPWGVLWGGTAEQLIAAGVVEPAALRAHLELRVGRGHVRPHLKLPSGRYARIAAPRGARQRLQVWEEFDAPEAEQRDRRRRAARRARTWSEQWGTPQAARQSARWLLRGGQAAVGQAFNLLRSNEAPHQFDAATCAEVLACLQALDRLFEAGTMSFTPPPRLADPAFETFLQRVTHCASP
jgi:hypothetical protein